MVGCKRRFITVDCRIFSNCFIKCQYLNFVDRYKSRKGISDYGLGYILSIINPSTLEIQVKIKRVVSMFLLITGNDFWCTALEFERLPE